jgi:hypothetical protein
LADGRIHCEGVDVLVLLGSGFQFEQKFEIRKKYGNGIRVPKWMEELDLEIHHEKENITQVTQVE